MLALLAPLAGYGVYQAFLFVLAGYHEHAARAAIARRDFGEADARLQQLVKLRPHDPPIRLLAAQTARRQGDFATALEHLRAYRRDKGPREPLELEERLTRLQKGDLSEAAAVLDAGLGRPDVAETPLMLEAYIEGTLEVFAAAAATGVPIELTKDAGLRRALDCWLTHFTAPHDQVQGLVWRGRMRTLLNEHADARADFRASLQQDPTDIAARWHLAKSLLQTEPAESARLLESLRRDRPNNRDVLLLLATARRGQGELREAAQLLDDVLAAAPDEPMLLLERGKVALDERLPHEAEKWLRRADQLAPETPEIMRDLARCLRVAGREAEAQRYQEQCEKAEAQRQARQEELLRKLKPLTQGEAPGAP